MPERPVSSIIPPQILLMLHMLFPDPNDLGLASDSLWFSRIGQLIDGWREEYDEVSIGPKLASQMGQALPARYLNHVIDSDLAYIHGKISGHIVNFVLSADAYSDTRIHASVSAASRCIHQLNKKARGCGVANIQMNIWPKFRKVASLWAALLNFLNENPTKSFVNFSAQDCTIILSRAMKIQQLGQNCRLYHSKSFLLDRSESWLGNWRSIGSASNFQYGRLPQELIEAARPS
jgi:hypothetical protein